MTLTVLSLGAGVQSSALLIAAAEGLLPKPDLAVFADTGWEPKSVYTHLDRLISEWAEPAGIPVEKVAAGDIRADTLDPDYPATMPFFLAEEDGTHRGVVRRQCTTRYKIQPVMRAVRKALGAKVVQKPCDRCEGSGWRTIPWSLKMESGERKGECAPCRGTGGVTRIGPVPKGTDPVDMWIGFSTDEIERVADSRLHYVRHVFPLLDLNWSRATCEHYLNARGVAPQKSACIGCPFHDNAMWRELRDDDPESWADAVDFDAAVRNRDDQLRLVRYLHPQRVPLDLAVIDPQTRKEKRGLQSSIFDHIAQGEIDDHVRGCSPFGCRTDAGADGAQELADMLADEVI